MGPFTKGEIVLYLFPYTNLKGKKFRPCLVLSNQIGEDIILCQITSKNISANNYSIELKKSETLNGSLQIDSYIRCNMLFTAEVNDIVKIICKINKNKYLRVINKIFSILNL